NTLDPTLLAEATFVDGVYRHVLGRSADAPSLVGWVHMRQQGIPRPYVVDAVWTSAEHRGLEVDRLYQTFLRRNADPAGRADWVNALLAGASEMDVARGLMASAEFQSAHADNASYLANVYVDVLGRAPSAAEIVGWSTTLKNGAGRDAVAVAVLTSSESYRLIMDGAYTNLLHRAPDAAGEQAWVAGLVSGRVRPGAVCENFLASDEFFALARTASQG